MQRLQEGFHGDAHDYRAGSPHLAHLSLYDGLVELLHRALVALQDRALPLTLLEVGAGHGGYTEAALAFGCTVTATEMSRPSLERLRQRYGLNARFAGLFDPDGSLACLEDRRFSMVLCSSVLHHIPDYEGFVGGPVFAHLAPGGTILSIQDPLWRPRMPRAALVATQVAGYAWRLRQGNYGRGLRTIGRRIQGRYDEENPSDMVEYHAVRQGVDEEALERLLRPAFGHVAVARYWSTYGAFWQRLGERTPLVNTFGILAEDFQPAGGG